MVEKKAFVDRWEIMDSDMCPGHIWASPEW